MSDKLKKLQDENKKLKAKLSAITKASKGWEKACKSHLKMQKALEKALLSYEKGEEKGDITQSQLRVIRAGSKTIDDLHKALSRSEQDWRVVFRIQEDFNKIYKEIFEHTFTFDVNMNDVFEWACADMETIESDNMEELLPLMRIYGVGHVLYAYASVKRGYEVQEPLKKLKSFDVHKYHSAMKTIKRWRDDGKIEFEIDTHGFFAKKKEDGPQMVREGSVIKVKPSNQPRPKNPPPAPPKKDIQA